MSSYEAPSLREDYIQGVGGAELYVRVDGDAGPFLVLCNGLGVASDVFWRYLRNHFRRSCRVVAWDYPGHGRSANPEDPDEAAVENYAENLEHVLDHVCAPNALLIGHSLGVQVILEAYRRYPERVMGLVPVLGTFGKPLDTFLGSEQSPLLFGALAAAALRFPKLGGAVWRTCTRNPIFFQGVARVSGLIHPTMCPLDDMERYRAHLHSISPEVFFSLGLNAQNHDAGDLLDEVQVPVLVIAGERDLFTPMDRSVEMSKRMPKAELLSIKHGTHAALVEQPELVNSRLELFMRKWFPGAMDVGDRRAEQNKEQQ